MAVDGVVRLDVVGHGDLAPAAVGRDEVPFARGRPGTIGSDADRERVAVHADTVAGRIVCVCVWIGGGGVGVCVCVNESLSVEGEYCSLGVLECRCDRVSGSAGVKSATTSAMAQ